VFHARMAEERGWFDFAQVAGAIHEKLVRRHPHVFGGRSVSGDAELSRAWEEQKARERAAGAAAGSVSALADVPRGLPALVRAAKLGKRAGRVGFDWGDAAGVRDKVLEELGEVDAALAAAAAAGPGDSPSPAGGTGARDADTEGGAGVGTAITNSPAVVEEMGDLLFAVANWSRHLKFDAEDALRAANAKFERRFRDMEGFARARGLSLETLSPQQWENLWAEAKTLERESSQLTHNM